VLWEPEMLVPEATQPSLQEEVTPWSPLCAQEWPDHQHGLGMAEGVGCHFRQKSQTGR
jgi:hypothetical protein